MRKKKRRATFAEMVKKLGKLVRKYPLSFIGILVLVVVVASAIFAPALAPYPPEKVERQARLKGPSRQHLLGTDHLGRDILSRIIHGSRVSLQVMAISVSFAAVIGVFLGLISGYVGGWVDDAIMRFMDGLYAFPNLVLALAIIAFLGPGMTNMMMAIGVVNIPRFARLARGETLVLKEKEFIKAAHALGSPAPLTIVRHVIPNILGKIIVFATLQGSQAIITESSLSYLGLGVAPPTPTWGMMVSDGIRYWNHAWWLSLFPGLAIFLTVLAINFVGDSLRDYLDPTLRNVE